METKNGSHMDSEKAKKWWNRLEHFRKVKLAEFHYWTTPAQMTEEMILFVYKEELNKY